MEQLRKAQMIELLREGKRLDSRGLLDYRKIVIETNVVEKANGSAKVNLGNTQVIAGVKIETGNPFPDTPDKGIIVVNAEVAPISSPYAEPGPPDEGTIELARVVDRGIRESQMLDLSKLCIVSGKKVLAVFVDISVLDVDGNLFDAASYAAVAALVTSKFPEFVVDGEEHKPSGRILPLMASTLPVSITLWKIGDSIIIDPTAEEEAVVDARITLVTNSAGNVCAGQKGLSGSFSVEQLRGAPEISIRKGEEVRALMKEATGFGKE